MSRRLITAVIAIVALCAMTAAYAQVRGVTLPNGGWVPCDHPSAAGLCQEAPTTSTRRVSDPRITAQPPATAVACDYISPYTERPGCLIGDYRIGQVYAFGMTHGVVIGLSMASTGAEVVTVQYLHDWPNPPLQVWAFLNDGSQRPWEWRR